MVLVAWMVAAGQAATEAELQKAVSGEKLAEDEFVSVKKAVIKEAKSGFKSTGAMQQLITKLKDVPPVEIGPEKENQFRVLDHAGTVLHESDYNHSLGWINVSGSG